MKAYLFWAAVLSVVAWLPWRWELADIQVGSKAFTESVVLGDLLQQLAEDSGRSARHLRQLGGSRIVFEALKQRDIQAYVEYTGTIDRELLAGERVDGVVQRTERLLAEGIAISQPLGFGNTYALAIRRPLAESLGIRRISDLSRHGQIRFGFSNEFLDRQDGWPGLRQCYGLADRQVWGLDHDLAYRQLQVGEIDVTDAYTTDARIDPRTMTLLEDDLRYFPEYAAVILYAAELEAKAPALVASWRRLEGRLDEATVRRLNQQVELEQQPESLVAAAFLREVLQVERQVVEPTRWRRIARHAVEHLDMVRRSLLPAILIAIPLGIVASRRRGLGQVILAIAGIVQTIPALALLVLLIPVVHWLGASTVGRGSATVLVALFLYSLLPIVRNTVAGLKDVPAFYQDSARALGLTPFWVLSYVELPMATRSILAGIKTAAVMNVGYATLGALIGAGGLGQPILTGIRLNRFDLILDGAIPAAVLALGVQGLFELIERKLLSRGLA